MYVSQCSHYTAQIVLTLTLLELVTKAGMVGLPPNWVRLASTETNLGLFYDEKNLRNAFLDSHMRNVVPKFQSLG